MNRLRALLRSLFPARVLGNPVVVLAVLGAMFALACIQRAPLPVRDPDVWWLAAVGRDFVLHGVVPRTNAYSFASPTHPWVTHEAGFAAWYGFALGRFGPSFFPLFAMASAAVVTFLAARAALSRCRHPAAGAALALLSVGAASPGLFEPRPAYASLALPVAMVALAFGPRFSPRHGLGAVVLVWVWAQLHGSFVLGIALLAASAYSEPEDRRHRIAAVAVAVPVVLLNPYGMELPRLVARYVLGPDAVARFVLQSIKEFAPLWRAEPPYRNVFDYSMLAAAAVLVVVSLARKSTRHRGVVAACLLAAAVAQIRHLTLAVLLVPLLLGETVDRWLDRDPRTAGARAPRIGATALALAPGLFAGVLLWGQARAVREPEAWVDVSLGGPAAVALVRGLPPAAKVWTPFQTSALVLWYGAPHGARVLHDPRNDCYPLEIVRADWRLESVSTPAAEAWALLDATGVDTVVAPAVHPRSKELEHAIGWTRTAQQDGWQVHRRLAAPAR